MISRGESRCATSSYFCPGVPGRRHCNARACGARILASCLCQRAADVSPARRGVETSAPLVRPTVLFCAPGGCERARCARRAAGRSPVTTPLSGSELGGRRIGTAAFQCRGLGFSGLDTDHVPQLQLQKLRNTDPAHCHRSQGPEDLRPSRRSITHYVTGAYPFLGSPFASRRQRSREISGAASQDRRP